MKIAISTDEGFVSGHFGRCPSFTIFEVIDGVVSNKIEVENPGHLPGVIPKFLNEKGVNCIVSGGMGARAQQFFYEFNIKTIMGVQGTIDEVIDQILNNSIVAGESLCKPGGGKNYGVDKGVCDHVNEEDHTCPHPQPENLSEQKKEGIVCITSEGNTLNSQVDQRFGRCQYFIFYDLATGQFEVIQNPNVTGTGGVGVQSGQCVAEKKAIAVLTGKVGPNASQTLAAAEIKIFNDVTGTISEAIEQFKKDGLQLSKGPNAEEHSGIEQ